jgi:competence protein ComEC
VFSVGYRNRFRHPNGAVQARYRAVGARLLRTDRDGAISVQLRERGVQVQGERVRRARYWHGI